MRKILIFLVCLLGQAAIARTLMVTTGNDAGPGSLRQAIAVSGDGDVIQLHGVKLITLTSGYLAIQKSITIKGNGAIIKGDFSPIVKVSPEAAIRWQGVHFDIPVRAYRQLAMPDHAKQDFVGCSGQWEKPGSPRTLGTNLSLSDTTTVALPKGSRQVKLLSRFENEPCTDPNGCGGGDGGCGVSSVAPTAITGITTICSGESTELQVTGGTLGTNGEVQWFSGTCANGTPIATGNSITVSPSTTTNYFARYQGDCNTTPCATVTVTVAAPTGTLTITNSTCSNNELGGGSIAIGTVSGTGGSLEYSTDNGATWSSTLPSYNQTGPAQTILASVLGPGGCRSATTQVGVTVPGICVTQSIAPVISGNTTICGFPFPTSTTLSVEQPAGGTIQWFTGSCSGTPISSQSSITVSPNTTTTYYVRYIYVFTPTACALVTVTVNTPSVAPQGISGNTTICSGQQTNLTLQGGNAGTGATPQWFRGSCGGELVGTGNSIQVSPPVTTTYFVRYAGDCNTTPCASVTVTVNLPFAPPTGSLSITNSTCTNNEVSGGNISIGTVSGTGGTLQYSTNGGTNWSSILPAYNQSGPAQTIIASSVLGQGGCRSATTEVGVTVPGTCVTPPDYTITTTDNAIIITDISGNGETLDVSETVGNISFNVVGRTYALNNGTTMSFPVDVSLAGASSITINAAVGNDNINIGAFTQNLLPSLTVNGGMGNDAVNFNGSINFAADAHLDVDMQNDDADPGVDQVVFAANAVVTLQGSGTATIKVSRNVTLNNPSILRTENGALLVEANQQAMPTPENFVGVRLTGGKIESTGSGIVTVRGNGGASSGNANHGVFVEGSNAKITSGGGDVLVTGQGGGSSSFISALNSGVYVSIGGEITSGGGGKVTVNGTGGPSAGSSNIGVWVIGSNAKITSSSGAVSVTGQGGGSSGTSSGSNIGVSVASGGEITAGGSATVTVKGTGGAGASNLNLGVIVINSNSKITSSGGAVSVTGQGNGIGNSGENYGVHVTNNGEITAGGSGTVTVTGTGAPTAGNNNYGVIVRNSNSKINSVGGAVLVNGQGGGVAADIIMEFGGMITSTSNTSGLVLHSTTNGTWPNTAGTDVSTTATQYTTFGANSKLNIDIDGLTVNTQYQQLGVVGGINLNGAILTFNGSTYTPALGNSFTIVDNDGTDAVMGTFNGLPEGTAIPNFLGSGFNGNISYTGGDGNDVVITVEACPASGTILYVNAAATGANTGISWTDAFADLQSALASNCPDITEIWVAKGTYTPSAYPAGCVGCATPRDYTFSLKDGVSLYGGFAGTEATLDERNIELNPTILTGELSGGQRAYHVVISVDAETRIDGFTITGGDANGSGSITVNGVLINHNGGGGIFARGGANTLMNNTIKDNNASDGGGILMLLGTNTLMNNKVISNSSVNYGGGMWLIEGTNTITNNTISDNEARFPTSAGGGIFIDRGSNVLKGNTLKGNVSEMGGGIYIRFGEVSLTNNTLTNNLARTNGGGIYIYALKTTLTNNRLQNNRANNGNGGGIFIDGGTNMLVNNTFTGNTATTGGGIYTNFGINTLKNSIIWGNSSGIFSNSNPMTVTYSIVQGNGVYPGIGNLNVDPLFMDAAAGDLSLQACSPAIDAGTNSALAVDITTDINGAPRFINATAMAEAIVDMGAYEYQSTVPALSISYPSTLDIEGCNENEITATNNGFAFSTNATPISVVAFVAAGGTVQNDACLASLSYQDVLEIYGGTDLQIKAIVNRTFTATDTRGKTYVSTQVITVKDVTAPTFTAPANVQVDCASQVPVADINTVTNVSDNCGGVVTVAHQDDVITAGSCANRYTITRTYIATDASGNTTSQTQIITVDDQTPPVWSTAANALDRTIYCGQASALAAAQALAPTATDNCGGTVTYSKTSGAFVPAGAGGAGTYTNTWIAYDGCGNVSAVFTQVITIQGIAAIDVSASSTPVLITNDVFLKANISPKVGGVTIQFLVDGVPVIPTVVTNDTGYAELNIGRKLLGVYEIVAKAIPGCGESDPAYVPVYDGSGNFVTGGGWINSPAGAMPANPTAVGKANFGFVSKYKKGSSAVDGNTDFQFHAGDLDFNSTMHEGGSLVISGGKATYRGTGTVNGVPGYKFVVVAIDGHWNGQNNPDRFRIKISSLTGGTVIYDNQQGAGEHLADATILGNNGTGGGAIVIHQTGKKAAEPIEPLITSNSLDVKVQNNPSMGGSPFRLQVRSNDPITPIQMQVINGGGQVVEARQGIAAGTTVEMGASYVGGIYLVQVMQGKQLRTVKLIKQ